jgi:hypothetical protein
MFVLTKMKQHLLAFNEIQEIVDHIEQINDRFLHLHLNEHLDVAIHTNLQVMYSEKKSFI